eukprot:GHVT01054313.1.p1 GENE.GHVT01054313.1~~GHVT01054313.1.p1  ORF type:complete len:198 (+),score=1.72 GHVT01054313.1:316-909(+)
MVAKHALDRPVKAHAPRRVASIAPMSKQLRPFSKPKRCRLRSYNAKFFIWTAISIALLGGCFVIVNNCMRSARRCHQPEPKPIPSAEIHVGFDLSACDSVFPKDQEFVAKTFQNFTLLMPDFIDYPPSYWACFSKRAQKILHRVLAGMMGVPLAFVAIFVAPMVIFPYPWMVAIGAAFLSFAIINLITYVITEFKKC